MDGGFKKKECIMDYSQNHSRDEHMNELLDQLESKIQAAIEQIGLYQLEIEELKEKNSELEAQREDWNTKLTGLIEKFEQLDADSEEDDSEEDASDDEESSEEDTSDEGDSEEGGEDASSEENGDGDYSSNSEQHDDSGHHE